MSLFGITLGDPRGIGPEVTYRALQMLDESQRKRFCLYGSKEVWNEVCQFFDEAIDIDIHSFKGHKEGRFELSDNVSGMHQIQALEAAVQDCKNGRLAGLVTAPIHKAVMRSAGFKFNGHTDYLAHAFSCTAKMMFWTESLRLVLATVHIPLAEVSRMLSQERVVSAGVGLVKALQTFAGVQRPRIGVLGLNPHAGEGGLLGMEEKDVIAPAISKLQEICEVVGPLVPDVAFRKRDEFDGFVAMYHDQGLIPLKLLAFESAVNVTMGLPIVRTSPDHGVAYDIASSYCADGRSMHAAMELALQWAAAP